MTTNRTHPTGPAVPSGRAERAERAESAALVVILATVAVSAGWASFTHVHDWTMRHTPAGTPDAFGWVNAVISELVPVAAFLTIRRRRRAGQPIGYPLGLLLASASLSLAAQLAVATPSPSGWLLSAVPALAFMALVKLVFAAPAPAPATVSTVTPEDPAGGADGEDQAVTLPDPPPSAPPFAPGLAPVPAAEFTRVNGTALRKEVTR
jgi:hypothetical protein